MHLRSLKSAYRFPLVRRLVHRFGPAVWRLPRGLRWRVCHESQIAGLPGTQVWGYGAAEVVRPGLPESGGLPTFGHRLAARAYRCAAPFVARLPRAWLVGKHACPVTPDGRVLLTPFRDGARILGLEPNADLVAFVERLRRQGGGDEAPGLVGEVMPLVGRLDANYFHWLTESAAQVEGLEAYERGTGCSPAVLIRGGGPAYIRQSLELLGVPAGRMVEWDEASPPIPVEGALVGSIPGNRVACSPRSLRWLRERFLARAGVLSGESGGRRLYVRRRPGGWRSAVNDQELTDFLHERGFETVQAEAMSFVEQVRLFNSADVILGLHGAGLTNVLFAPRATVVELIGAYGDSSWFSMAACLGNPYHALSCAGGGRDGHDVVVDCHRLSVLLNSLPVQVTARQEWAGPLVTGGIR